MLGIGISDGTHCTREAAVSMWLVVNIGAWDIIICTFVEQEESGISVTHQSFERIYQGQWLTSVGARR